MKPTLWILVCDASRARLLRTTSKNRGLVMIEAFEHRESRAHVRDLMADAHGRKPVGPVPASRAYGPGGGHGRPGAEPDTDAKEVEAQKFARELAGMLEKRLNEHAYDQLIIAAPPHFLGTVRNAVSTQVAKHIEATIDKDFTGLELHDLADRLLRPRAA
jgi:protein required for attachment to host cells